MKELKASYNEGNKEHFLIQKGKSFIINKKEFKVNDVLTDEIIISTTDANNIVVKENIETKIGKLSFELISENSEQSKINIEVYKLAQETPQVNIEQLVADSTVDAIQEQKSIDKNEDIHEPKKQGFLKKIFSKN